MRHSAAYRPPWGRHHSAHQDAGGCPRRTGLRLAPRCSGDADRSCWWPSPCKTSPMADQGNETSQFRAIHLALRGPRVAIELEAGDGWHSRAALAMFVSGHAWAGAGFAVAFSDHNGLNPAAAHLLNALDPDHVVGLTYTGTQMEAITPGSPSQASSSCHPLRTRAPYRPRLGPTASPDHYSRPAVHAATTPWILNSPFN
jgi:hypothetical protein